MKTLRNLSLLLADIKGSYCTLLSEPTLQVRQANNDGLVNAQGQGNLTGITGIEFFRIDLDQSEAAIENGSLPEPYPLKIEDQVGVKVVYTVQDVQLLRTLVNSNERDYSDVSKPSTIEYERFVKWLVQTGITPGIPPGISARWNSTFYGLSKNHTLEDDRYGAVSHLCGPVYETLFRNLRVNSNRAVNGEDGKVEDPEFALVRTLENLAIEFWDIQSVDPLLLGSNLAPFRLGCPLTLRNAANLPSETFNCYEGRWQAGPYTWDTQDTDVNLALVTSGGGADTEGVWWDGIEPGEDLSVYLGSIMLGSFDFKCRLETKCGTELECNRIGSRQALALGTQNEVLLSIWGFVTIRALINLNDQLSNQYIAIKGAAIAATLELFKIQKFYPIPDQQFSLRNVLAGLGTAFGIIGGFVPAVGPLIGGAGALLPEIGGILGNKLAESITPEVVQENVAQKLEIIYSNYVAELNTMTTSLFKGDKIDDAGNITLLNMLKEGAWANKSALTPVSLIEQQMKVELLSRSIDALWKTKTSNKMWVLYTDLQDDQNGTICKSNTDGPQKLRYCADGGVYYAYNYIEDGNLGGRVGYPWGTENLAEFNISTASLVEGSARTYRLAQNKTYQLDPFNFDAGKTTVSFLTDALYNPSYGDLSNMAGKYPGSWTIPVCNAGRWGKRWNANYDGGEVPKFITSITLGRKIESRGSPPCICGPGGVETAAWARAAGLEGFQTYYQACKYQLEDDNFEWPDGVRCVELGDGNVYKAPGVQVC